ncbi:hypothetical protein MP228_008905 [Amoeboaphelidium protococcarum]|nr:hypothetical protein MP228_008905 [Amoeboaphelidium protococcarum]
MSDLSDSEYSSSDSISEIHSDSEGERNAYEQLQDIPFGDILQVKQKAAQIEGGHNDNDDDYQPEFNKRIDNTNSVNNKRKRANKNAPMEVSSKYPVSRKRQVVDASFLPDHKARDPRFDAISTATVDDKDKHREELFARSSYSFIKDYQKSEMDMLIKQIKKERNPEEKERLNKVLSRLKSRLVEADRRERQQTLKREWKKSEENRVGDGQKQKQFYLKKSDIKKLEVIDQYKQLKAKGNSDKIVDRIMEKKRKKNMSKDKATNIGDFKKRYR